MPRNDKNNTIWSNFFSRIGVSTAIGSCVMTALTPIYYWSNLAFKNQQFGWRDIISRKAMTGAPQYALSAMPVYTAAFGTHTLLTNYFKEKNRLTDGNKMIIAAVAGAFAGFASTPFESIAQNKQLTRIKYPRSTFNQMRHANGISVYLRGALSVILRESAWATTYMAVLPIFSSTLQQTYRIKKNRADIFSSIVTAGTFGILSSPLAQLRFNKQLYLTEKAASKSYLSIINKIYFQQPSASITQRIGFFFKGAKPRGIAATTSAFLIHKGRETFDALNTIK
jgi:Mitochondrial carrier protein